MTQLVEHVILDIGFVSLSPMLGRVYFKKTNKPEFSFSFFSSEKLRECKGQNIIFQNYFVFNIISLYS